MATTAAKVGGELQKDKYLCFALCMVLLGVYLATREQTIGTLLTAAVGGFIGLLRSAQSNNSENENGI